MKNKRLKQFFKDYFYDYRLYLYTLWSIIASYGWYITFSSLGIFNFIFCFALAILGLYLTKKVEYLRGVTGKIILAGKIVEMRDINRHDSLISEEDNQKIRIFTGIKGTIVFILVISCFWIFKFI